MYKTELLTHSSRSNTSVVRELCVQIVSNTCRWRGWKFDGKLKRKGKREERREGNIILRQERKIIRFNNFNQASVSSSTPQHPNKTEHPSYPCISSVHPTHHSPYSYHSYTSNLILIPQSHHTHTKDSNVQHDQQHRRLHLDR